MAIPKVIHYCWFGKNTMPIEAVECINSWKRICPDYEIKEWNEDNFDISTNEYVKEAYLNKKYAFVTDYVRLYALYNYGGIYMDTDVEVLKSLDRFLIHPAFSGFEDNMSIPTGIMASEKGNKWVKAMLDDYQDLSFVFPDGTFDLTTNVVRITRKTKDLYQLKLDNQYQELNDVVFYPCEYFCPKSWRTGEITVTDNTYTIHHFNGSWQTKKDKRHKNVRDSLKKIFGNKIGLQLYKVYSYFIFVFDVPKIISEKIRKNKT